MSHWKETKVGRATIRVRAPARAHESGCKAQCRRDYPKGSSARVQCFRTCKEMNGGRAANQDPTEGQYGGQAAPGPDTGAGPGWPPCQPGWPNLPPGASLTIDPSRPPPTTQQQPFCDWPASSCLADVESYPPVQATMPPQPRLSNVGRMQARVRARQTARGRRGGASVRGIPHCRDSTCCSVHCTERFPGAPFLWKSCMTACKGMNLIGPAPRALRSRNQGLRFDQLASDIASLSARRTR